MSGSGLEERSRHVYVSMANLGPEWHWALAWGRAIALLEGDLRLLGGGGARRGLEEVLRQLRAEEGHLGEVLPTGGNPWAGLTADYGRGPRRRPVANHGAQRGARP